MEDIANPIGPNGYPRYRSHKVVEAMKIGAVLVDENGNGGTLVPADDRRPSAHVSAEWLERHRPQAGGYYVVYPDGYTSWSPAQAFEEGYALL